MFQLRQSFRTSAVTRVDHAPPRATKLTGFCFVRDLRGAAAVEFGLVGLIFMMVFCFILEVGLTMFMQTALDQATLVASRLIRIGSIQTAGGSVTPFTTALCNKLSALMTCSAIQYNVVSGSTFASLSTTVTTNSSNQMSGTQFTPGTAGQDVVVQVGYTRTIYLPFVSSFLGKNGTLLMVSTAAFQNEPY